MSERATYESWVREHHAGVYRAAHRVLRDVDDAMEVTQEVFLDALRNVARVAAADDAGRVLRWKAVKVALMRIRSDEARRRREGAPDARWQGTPVEAPDAPAARDEEEAALARGLAGLPDDLRFAVALRFQDGLTFAQIGEVLSCSSTHAHDRVRRGLTGLRRFLAGTSAAALAGEASGLEDALAGLSAATAPPVPASLAQCLLAAPGVPAAAAANATGLLAAGPPVLAAALVLASAIGLVAFGDDPPEAPAGFEGSPLIVAAAVDPPGGGDANDPPPRAPAPPRPATREEAVAEEPPAEAAPAPAVVVRGTVVDASSGPLEGLVVEARSLDRSGKGTPLIGGRSRTAADGTFSIPLEAPPKAGETWTFLVSVESVVLDTDTLLVRPDVAPRAVRLRVTEPLDEAPGDWMLDLVLRDDAGRPLADALVAIHRRLGRGSTRVVSTAEARGRTDAFGQVRLSGVVRGSKELRLLPVQLAMDPPKVDLEVRDPFVRRELTVFDPKDVAGRVVDPDGRAVEGAEVVGSPHGRATTDADGRFRLDDVGPGVLSLEATHDRGTASRSNVVTGHGDVHLELVPRDAPLASITGRAFDAANGAPIPIPWDYDVDVLPIDDDLPLDVLRGDLLPNHAIPISRQQFDMGHHPEPSEAFTLDGLERRRVVLRLKVPGYAPEFLGPFDLAERPVVDDVVARLHRPGTLSGRVLDAAGNPVANAYLVVTGAGPRSTDRMDTLDAVVRAIGGGGAPLPDAQTRTREDGRFSLHGLPIGLPLRVVALHATHARGATGVVVLREGATRDGLEVRLGAERER